MGPPLSIHAPDWLPSRQARCSYRFSLAVSPQGKGLSPLSSQEHPDCFLCFRRWPVLYFAAPPRRLRLSIEASDASFHVSRPVLHGRPSITNGRPFWMIVHSGWSSVLDASILFANTTNYLIGPSCSGPAGPVPRPARAVFRAEGRQAPTCETANPSDSEIVRSRPRALTQADD